MAVRSLQIRAKFITFIEIKAPRCRGVRRLILSQMFPREDIDCMIGDQGEFGPALERGGTLEMAVRMAELTGCRANGRIRA